MKRFAFAWTAIFVAGSMVGTALAQPPEGERPRREGGPRGEAGPREGGPRGEAGPRRGPGGPPNLILEALDANGDFEISADEIKNAAAALVKLDKNKDGKLTRDELRPQFDGPGRGEGGPRGAAREGGQARGPAGGGGNAEQFIARVMALDKNKDGKVSKDEMPERMQSMLTRADTNKDGALDKEELTAAAARFSAGRGPGAGRERGEGGGERPRRPDRPQEE